MIRHDPKSAYCECDGCMFSVHHPKPPPRSSQPDPRDHALELAEKALVGCKPFVSDERYVQIGETLAAIRKARGGA